MVCVKSEIPHYHSSKIRDSKKTYGDNRISGVPFVRRNDEIDRHAYAGQHGHSPASPGDQIIVIISQMTFRTHGKTRSK